MNFSPASLLLLLVFFSALGTETWVLYLQARALHLEPPTQPSCFQFLIEIRIPTFVQACVEPPSSISTLYVAGVIVTISPLLFCMRDSEFSLCLLCPSQSISATITEPQRLNNLLRNMISSQFQWLGCLITSCLHMATALLWGYSAWWPCKTAREHSAIITIPFLSKESYCHDNHIDTILFARVS